ncbi:MAG: hypothetical protein FJ033_07145 [Chloroflexi bacterium]|nr:hypothetical protein [Chloroflexota bacterium]
MTEGTLPGTEPNPPARSRMPEWARRGVVGQVFGFGERHPLLTSWAVLAIAMVALLVYTSRDVGLLPSQLAAMIVATVLLAGACVWIISWE